MENKKTIAKMSWAYAYECQRMLARMLKT
jgi:hypothetical protein